MGVRRRAELRSHQADAIVLSIDTETIARVPRSPDSSHHLDILAQPLHRCSPRHTEASFDVPANLSSETKDKSTARKIVDGARAIRGDSWTARESQRNSGGNPERRGRASDLPGEYEGVALDLRD